MSKPKFKIGDRVRVLNGSAINNYTGGWFPNMEQFVGKVYKIRDCVRRCQTFGYKLKGTPEIKIFDERGLELVTPEKIIIYRNGSEVIAKNTLTGKTGVAKCNPADEFDFEIGAKLAFDRLVESEPEKPKYYTGRVVCVHSVNSVFTKGKIYKVSDGRLYSNDSFTYSRFSSVESINKALAYKFIELVE